MTHSHSSDCSMFIDVLLVTLCAGWLWPPSTEEWVRKHIVLLTHRGSETLWAELVRWSIRWRGELASLPQTLLEFY